VDNMKEVRHVHCLVSLISLIWSSDYLLGGYESKGSRLRKVDNKKELGQIPGHCIVSSRQFIRRV